MQTFGLNYEVKPERIEDFKKAAAQLIDAVQGLDGHIETRLFSDVAKPHSMMIYSNWKTKAEFGNFIRSDTFKQALSEAVDMLERSPTHFAAENIRLIKPSDQTGQ